MRKEFVIQKKLTNKISDEELKFIQQLFPEINEQTWEWEFLRSPNQSDIYFAKHLGDLVGHYSLIKIPFQVGSYCYPGGKGEGSLTDSKRILKISTNSDRRVFYWLVREALEKAAQQDLKVIYALANKFAMITQVMAGYRAIKFPIVQAIFNQKFQLNPRNNLLQKLLKRLYNLITPIYLLRYSRYQKNHILPITENHREHLERFVQKLGTVFPRMITPYRSWEYVRWRYSECPYQKIEVFGYFNKHMELYGFLALSSRENDGVVMGRIEDIISVDEESMDALLRYTFHWIKTNKIDTMAVWTIEKYAHYQFLNSCLSRHYFRIPNPKATRHIIIAGSLGEELYNPENWHVSLSFRRD